MDLAIKKPVDDWTDEEVLEHRKTWDPAQYEDHENLSFKQTAQQVAEHFYTMPINQYREYLRNVERRNAEANA